MEKRFLDKPFYDNALMLNQDGTPMGRLSNKVANFYLLNNLAEKISDTPLTIKLLFTPKGNGSTGDEYLLLSREDICVVCGNDSNLARTYIVPYQYRHVMGQLEKKNMNAADVVLSCEACHNMYSTLADLLRAEIVKELGRDLEELKPKLDVKLTWAVQAANTLYLHYDVIPEDKREVLQQRVLSCFPKCNLKEDLYQIRKVNCTVYPKESEAQFVMESYKDWTAFTIRWRKYFLEKMQPRFMPENYSLLRNYKGELI